MVFNRKTANQDITITSEKNNKIDQMPNELIDVAAKTARQIEAWIKIQRKNKDPLILLNFSSEFGARNLSGFFLTGVKNIIIGIQAYMNIKMIGNAINEKVMGTDAKTDGE